MADLQSSSDPLPTPPLRGVSLRRWGSEAVPARLQRRAARAYRHQRSGAVREPSFNYKALEAARIREQLRAYGVKDPAFYVDSKDDAHAWLTRLGERTPQLLGSYEGADLIPWDDLPDRCVVKPARGTSSTGVYLLVRRPQGWREITAGRDLTQVELVVELSALYAQGELAGPVLVEELVDDPRTPDGGPIDYKVHTFFGRVGLIECKLRLPGDDGEPVSWFCIYDETWRELGNLFIDSHYAAAIPPPRAPHRLLDVARRVSAAIPRPYLRVDLMEDSSGPAVCEITPEPGGSVLVDHRTDRRLGLLWEDAEVRLRVRAVGTGLLDPVDEPLPEASLRPGDA